MNPIGVNAWVWVSPPTDESITAIAPRVKAMGFDVLELGLENPGDKLTVADIKVPAGITITTEPEQSIATVEVPKDQVAEADAAVAEQAEADGTTAEEETEGGEAEGEGEAASESGEAKADESKSEESS